MQALDIDIHQAEVAQQMFDHGRGDGVAMGGVVIKGMAADLHILGVGGFKQQQAARRQHPLALLHQAEQGLEGQVFDHMKGGDCAEAGVGLAAQIGNRIL